MKLSAATEPQEPSAQSAPEISETRRWRCQMLITGKPRVYKQGDSWRLEIPQRIVASPEPFGRVHPLTWDFPTWHEAILASADRWFFVPGGAK